MAVSRLNARGLIEKQIDDGKVILKLTDAGRGWVLKYQTEDKIQWDGIWRLVIFDIPESHNKIRVALRSKLKAWGFVKWQKSVWASKKPLTVQIRELVHDLGVDDWVIVIESQNTGKSKL